MGYTYRNNGQITDFWPDDTENKWYISASVSPTLGDLIDMIKEEWPETDLYNVTITSERIHTRSLTYDLYDPSDYTDFIVIERKV